MKEQDDILLSRYLAGDLPERELREVEQRLNADPDFAGALQQRQQEDVFLRTEADVPDLRAKMAELAEEHFRAGTRVQSKEQEKQGSGQEEPETGSRPPAKVRKLSWWRYAASGAVAALVILSLWWFDALSSGEPYQQYAQYEPLALTEKSDGLPATAAPAETAFNAGDYEQAFNLLTTYLRERPDDNQARLALGIAALETDRDGVARQIFTALAEGTTSYRDDGQFYLGLALFKAGDSAAREALEKISPENPDYGVRSREMLQLME